MCIRDSGIYDITGSTVVSGGTLNLETSTPAVIGGTQTTVSGGGTLNLENNTNTVAALTFSGGTITGTSLSSLTIGGAFIWSGGTLSEPTTMANDGINFSGSSDDFLIGAVTLTNASGQSATIGATGDVALLLESGATFTNAEMCIRDRM